MLQNLPEFACNILVEQYLTDLEVKTLRLVSKGSKSWIDTNLTALKPRAFSRSQVTTLQPVASHLIHYIMSACLSCAAPPGLTLDITPFTGAFC